MTRWIVAGLLLLVLVGLIVMDEVGFTPAQPVVRAGAEPTGQEPAVGAVAAEVVDAEADAKDVVREPATEACAAVTAVLEAELGAEKLVVVGDALFEGKKMTADEVANLCRSLEGKPADVVVARVLEVSGTAP